MSFLPKGHFCYPSQPLLVAPCLPCVFLAEAAARATRQAQTEDLTRVDVEHVEKVLPQLVCNTQLGFLN